MEPDASTPFFSIVIPTLNEEHYLPSVLLDLSNQAFRDFEIIILDANSEDQTIRKVQQLDHVKLPWRQVNELNILIAPTAAVAETSGPHASVLIIGWLQNDILPPFAPQ